MIRGVADGGWSLEAAGGCGGSRLPRRRHQRRQGTWLGSQGGRERAQGCPWAASLQGWLGPWAALLRYNADRLPVVHRYQERSRQVSARTGRMRRPRVGGRGDQEAAGGASGHSSEAGTASQPATANPA